MIGLLTENVSLADKYVSVKAVSSQITTGGYYRVATINNPVHGLATLMTINTTYSYLNNSSITVLINATYWSANITVLGKQENFENLINAIRIVADGSTKHHVMIGYNAAQANNVYVDFVVLGAHSGASIETSNFEADSSEYSGVIASVNP